MNLCKKENFWVWIIFYVCLGGFNSLIMGCALNLYDKNKWYANPAVWVISILLLIFPALILFAIFQLQILCESAKKLKVPGEKIYLNPIMWLMGIIIPFIGWGFLTVLIIYINIYIIYQFSQGIAEENI